MQQLRLERDYFFEFAGMPRSGKSTVEDTVAHFLKRQGFAIGEYRGGSRYSSLYNSSIADLNYSLVCRAADFVISSAGREKEGHKIFLLDRGIIDRCLFTEALFIRNQIDSDSAHNIENFLTSPRLINKIDGVFIFVTTPELAMERENENKLVETEGGVMNRAFLRDMRLAVENGTQRIRSRLPDLNIHFFDTEHFNGQVKETARDIVDIILEVVHKPVG